MTTDIKLSSAETIVTGPGVTVEATWHHPAGRPRGVAVVAPGVAVPASFINPLAAHLAAHGWLALTFDFPGIGASRIHPRDVPGGMSEWGARDLDAVLRRAAEAAADTADGHLIHVGHSAGAWLLALTPMVRQLDAVVAIASMSGYWRNLKRASWPSIVPGVFAVIPLAAKLLGYVPGRLALKEDAPGQVLAEWAGWCRREDFLFGGTSARTYLEELTAPTLALLPTDDEWATEPSVRAMWSHTSGPLELRRVDPTDHGGERIGHMGLLRKRLAADVWVDLVDWVEEVLPAVRHPAVV